MKSGSPRLRLRFGFSGSGVLPAWRLARYSSRCSAMRQERMHDCVRPCLPRTSDHEPDGLAAFFLTVFPGLAGFGDFLRAAFFSGVLGAAAGAFLALLRPTASERLASSACMRSEGAF